MGDRLSVLIETVGKYRCERCWKARDPKELVEETETGLIVCPEHVDKQGFNENRRDAGTESIPHHFDT